MRQIFSVRFLAAAGAVAGLFALLIAVFATRDAIDGAVGGGEPEPPTIHRIDLVEQVFASENPDFHFDADGLAAVGTRLVIDGSRAVTVVAGTPGESHCPDLVTVGACAMVVDLLGEGVVWLSLVPMGPGRSVELPAIDTLDEGWATLVNGWQLPHAPELDRRCPDDDFESYRRLRDALGDDFTTIFDLDQRRVTAVACRTRVPWAPELDGGTEGDAPATSTTTTTTIGTITSTPSPVPAPAG